MKTLTRKEFINLSLTSSLALPIIGFGCARDKTKVNPTVEQKQESKRYFDDIGFQVFALRNMLVDNAPPLFKSLAEVVIKNIEFFNPATLNEYVPIVKDCGMIPLCTHFMPGYISGNWETARKMNMAPPDNYFYENIIEDCNKNGIKYMGIAIMLQDDRQTLDDYKWFADKANQCGEKSKSAGIQLYYHNHSFEFEPTRGTTPYEEMLKIFNPELVKLELDVFWVTVAGLNPIYWLQKTGNRLLFLHMKDLKNGTLLGHYNTSIPADSFVELGDGMLDFKSILTEARRMGISYAIIDQDKTQMDDKIASVRKNCEYIKALGI